MKIDFRTLSLTPKVPPNTGWAITEMPVEMIRAQLACGESKHPQFALTPVQETPHYRSLQQGDPALYSSYLDTYAPLVGGNKEHSLEHFIALGRSLRYLQAPYQHDYIAVTPVLESENKIVFRILDGVHRLALLAYAGETRIPVVICGHKELSSQRIHLFVQAFKNHFLEWYTPVEFNPQTIIHERTFPHFKERPEFLENRERGMAKWNFIIRDALPDLAGLRVLDIGCNIGLYAIEMARLGARAVLGLDRSESIIQPTNPHLPRQNVVQQAWFIKRAFELRDGNAYDQVEFAEADIASFDFSSIEADMVFSTCVLYHFGPRFQEIVASFPDSVRTVFLQTNLGHSGMLSEWAKIETHQHILHHAGFHNIQVFAPPDYRYPVIVGTR